MKSQIMKAKRMIENDCKIIEILQSITNIDVIDNDNIVIRFNKSYGDELQYKIKKSHIYSRYIIEFKIKPDIVFSMGAHEVNFMESINNQIELCKIRIYDLQKSLIRYSTEARNE